MKAIVCLQYGEVNPAIELREDWPKPLRKQNSKQLLIRVLCCSTAFGDVHIMSGRVSIIAGAPSFPYIPGKDFCGVVEEADQDSVFKSGQIVVASREGNGGLGEYAVVDEKRTCLKPDSVDNYSAAACADSAITALNAFEKAKIKDGERILVLGGSGGVGSSLVQILKLANPSLIVATSTQHEMLTKLGVQTVIDYRTLNWWEIKEYIQEPFDVIIDCVGGNQHYTKSQSVLKNKKNGGRFLAVVGDEPLPLAQTVLQLMGFAGRMLSNPIRSAFSSTTPAYCMVISDSTADGMQRVMSLIESNKLSIMYDPQSPFEFTAEGVKQAFLLQASGRAHGKIIIKVADM